MAEESSSINSLPDECESPVPSSTSVSLATVVEEMTEAIETIKNTTGHLSAVSDNATILQTKILDPLSTYETKSQQQYLGDHLANIGAAPVFTSNIAWLRGMGHGGFSEGWPYMRYLYLCCHNYSDESQKFAEELAKAEIIPILVKDLQKFKETWRTNERCKDTASNSLGTLYNISRMSPSTRPLFRENKAIGSLIPYLMADNENFKTVATLTLAYVIDEKNLGIVADPSVIRFITNLFIKTVDDETKLWTVEGSSFSATELAMGIERLAVNDTPRDNNKLTLVEEGVLPPLFKLMTEGDEEERLHAILAISQLAFHPRNREGIRSVVPQLLKLKKSGNRDIAEASSGALWQLRDVESRVKGTGDGHAMLSYQWDDQETVKKMKNTLWSNGYKVWMDIDQMAGSTLEAMAKAVEGAAVVLICMSRKYKESANCRRECDYAVKRGVDIIPLKMESKYDPDGWLGITVGTRLYFDFDGKDSFENVMARLMKEIGDRGKEAVTEVDSADSQQEGPKLLNWTQDDIKEWIQKNQLDGDFESLEPGDLPFLYRLKKEAPDTFYKSIENELGQTTISRKRKFCDALENLK